MKTESMYLIQNGKVTDEFAIKVAETFKDRFMGLMGKTSLPDKEGLFFPKCSSIHCFFMKMSIDVVYLNKEYTVLYKETVKPWHIGKIVKHAVHIVELKEHAGDEINAGDRMPISENGEWFNRREAG